MSIAHPPGPYTRYPRATMWLVRGGDVRIGGPAASASPIFEAEVAPLYLSKSPITNEQFEVFAPSFERSPLGPAGDHPAVGIRWREAQAYCAWYSERTGRAFRLPTEVEAGSPCRAETAGDCFFGDDRQDAERFAWDAGSSGGRLHEVGARRANPFGLHDMLGLCWEHTASLWAPYPVEPGLAPACGPGPRVLRGGSLFTGREELAAWARLPVDPDEARPDVGFRIARSL